MATNKDLRTGWLLLLLDNSDCGYGYELRRELELRGLALDPAVMYRSLRDMESSGLIASRWERSQEGPRRRVYKTTATGRATLTAIAALVTDSIDAQDAFLSAYRSHRGQPRGARRTEPR